jgi:hypothetical protein
MTFVCRPQGRIGYSVREDMPMRRLALAIAAALTLGVTGASAHHSFAVFFDSERTVTITGVVTEFRFTNPHGMITIEVTDGGRTTIWRAETNSPSVLRRRGWTPGALTAGEVVTVEGWASRDGSSYLRMSRVTRQDGSVVGTPMTLGTVSEGETQ